jgi:hypothetical protein
MIAHRKIKCKLFIALFCIIFNFAFVFCPFAKITAGIHGARHCFFAAACALPKRSA